MIAHEEPLLKDHKNVFILFAGFKIELTRSSRKDFDS